MAFTKIAAAGIGSTETVTLHSLEVLNNATVGGVLTYEDVTNVDSIGIITARSNILVGSGITLSPDGDIFATGISTITGEVRLQNHLRLIDNKNIYLGDGADLEIRSGGSDGVINQANADLKIQRDGSGKVTFKSTGSHFIDDVFVVDKIIHEGDTNTAIRFPSDDEVTVETAGTERLSIEPAGNAQFHNYVNVGSGLTVGGLGAGTSLSTVVGQGFLELTRSSGDAYIDFKNAFAGDDFDCRIITSASNQLQFFTGGQGNALCALQTSTGKVGIATADSPSISKLQIHSDKLGGTAGNTQELLYVTSPDISNSTSYRFTNYRKSNGTTHVTSELRFRRHVDVTDMGYFGLGDGYASIGYGDYERFRVSVEGYVTKPQTPSFFVVINGGDATTNIGDKIPWNVVKHNTGNHYDTSNYYFVAPVSGHYYFHTQIWAKNSTSNARFVFNVADASNSYASDNISQHGFHSNGLNRQDNTTSASIVWYMDVGDRISVRPDNTNLTFYTAGATDPHSYFCGYLIG